MLSKFMGGAILATAAAGASAQTWDFSYRGFELYYQPTATRAFNPYATISGSFSGTDRNGDGVLTAPELSSFIIHSFEINGTDYARCSQDSTNDNRCSLDAFSFGPQDNLAFKVSWNRYIGGSAGLGSYGGITSGVAETVTTYARGDSFFSSWSWTPATTFAISPAPVPEPSRAALALAGLAALALGRLAATRQRRPGQGKQAVHAR